MLHIFQSLQKCIFCIWEIFFFQIEKIYISNIWAQWSFQLGRGVNKLRCRLRKVSKYERKHLGQYLTTQKVDLDNFSRKTFRLIVQSCNFLYIWIPLVYPELTCFWEFSRISVVGIIWWVVGWEKFGNIIKT